MKALLLLSLLGVVTLFSELFKFKKFLFPIILIGLVGVAVAMATEWGHGNVYFRMMRVDSFAILFTIAMITTTFLWFLMSRNTYINTTHETDNYALILFSLIGAMIMVSYYNMSMLFLGIEILSLSAYILAGSKKDDVASNEAALKYFLMGAFSTGFLLFGIALIYGSTGSFDLGKITEYVTNNAGNISYLFYTGVLLMLAALAFKVSAAPFHFWAPDVYEGAPTVVTAYMATVIKTAAFAAFFRLFFICFAGLTSHWQTIIWLLVALTLMIGNITAVFQTSVKRMLAYSSVSHAGYMLLAMLGIGAASAPSSILYYTIAYSVASITAFGVLNLLANTYNSEKVEVFNGLAKRNPFVAFVMTLALLSMSGIPPLAGFFAKYYIFTSAMANGYVGIVVIAILGSMVGVYYYFRIIIAMYLRESQNVGYSSPLQLSANLKALFVIGILLILLIGVFPDTVISWLRV